MALPGSLESHRAVGGGLLANHTASDPSGVAGMLRNQWLASVRITGWNGSESPVGLRRNTQPGGLARPVRPRPAGPPLGAHRHARASASRSSLRSGCRPQRVGPNPSRQTPPRLPGSPVMTKPPTRRTPKAKPSASRLPLASLLDKPARRKVAADRPVAQPTGRGKERSVVYLESSLPCSTDWHGIGICSTPPYELACARLYMVA